MFNLVMEFRVNGDPGGMLALRSPQNRKLRPAAVFRKRRILIVLVTHMGQHHFVSACFMPEVRSHCAQ
jgi:hypothetical protein